MCLCLADTWAAVAADDNARVVEAAAWREAKQPKTETGQKVPGGSAENAQAVRLLRVGLETGSAAFGARVPAVTFPVWMECG